MKTFACFLLLVMLTSWAMAEEQDIFYLVEQGTGQKLGPFEYRHGAGVMIQGRMYRIAEATTVVGAQLRLEKMIIPTLELRNASVEDVLNLLRETTMAGNNPVNLLLKVNDPSALPRVTLSMQQVSAYDVMRFTCEVAGLSFRFDGNTVILSGRR